MSITFCHDEISRAYNVLSAYSVLTAALRFDAVPFANAGEIYCVSAQLAEAKAIPSPVSLR